MMADVSSYDSECYERTESWKVFRVGRIVSCRSELSARAEREDQEREREPGGLAGN